MLSVTQHILDICIIVLLCNSVIVLNGMGSSRNADGYDEQLMIILWEEISPTEIR